MAIDISSLQSFSAADMLKLCEHNIAQINVGGQAYGADGKQLTRADLSTLYAQRDKLKQEIADEAAGATGGGNVLVRLNPSS